MADHERPEIAFLDEAGNPLGPDEIDDDAARDEAERRRASVERWLPHGGAAAVAGLVFVLAAWLGASPLAQAGSSLFPEGDHTYGPQDGSSFAGGTYYGISPAAGIIATFGTRMLVAAVALVFGLRARRSERSALSGACVATATVSLALFALAAVVMFVGVGLGHQSTGGVF